MNILKKPYLSGIPDYRNSAVTGGCRMMIIKHLKQLYYVSENPVILIRFQPGIIIQDSYGKSIFVN
jgi:hypothetical protein